MIAKAALASNSPTRALLYFEEYIESKGGDYNMSTHNEDLGFLLRIYNSLDEPDGVQVRIPFENLSPITRTTWAE